MRKWVILICIILLTGCAEKPEKTSYEETKKIVTDTLQTEEGKNVIRKMLSDPEFKELLILDQDVVKDSIEKNLLSKEAEKFWKDTFKDPKFSETFAKSMKEQQTEIMTALMKDSSFQKDLESFFGQPDMQKQLETIMKSSIMRKEMEKVVKETISSPLLQTKWQELIESAGSSGKEGEGGGGKEEEEGGGEEKKDEE